MFAGGATPLHIAADIGNLELTNCLLKAGADPNQKDEVKPSWKSVHLQDPILLFIW